MNNPIKYYDATFIISFIAFVIFADECTDGICDRTDPVRQTTAVGDFWPKGLLYHRLSPDSSGRKRRYPGGTGQDMYRLHKYQVKLTQNFCMEKLDRTTRFLV